jgi:DNA-binding PadR family transcriptional regulator
LVEPSPESGEAAGAVAGAESQAYYRLTDTGRAELARWFGTPVSRANPPRDDLTIKLAMAVTTPGTDVRQVVHEQRTATLRALQDYTRLKSRAADAEGRAGDLA